MQTIIRKYTSIFPLHDGNFWEEILKVMDMITEIRIRAEKPILIYMNHKEVSLDEDGRIIYVPEKGKRFSYKELQNLINFWCMDSLYAFQNEIKRGFMTIEGGHRIGICGETVMDEEGNIRMIKYISSVNIRIAHEIKGVAENVVEYIYGKDQIDNTLIVSPPGAGKTTLLRDIIRLVSTGNEKYSGKNVGMIDERGEIAACVQGIPQLDVGPRTDVLSNCIKKWGMRMLLRTMAPQVIAVDELGEIEEVELLQQMIGNGSSIIATVHGQGMEEIRQKKFLHNIWEQQMFENVLCLSKEKNRFCVEVFQKKDGEYVASARFDNDFCRNSWNWV